MQCLELKNIEFFPKGPQSSFTDSGRVYMYIHCTCLQKTARVMLRIHEYLSTTSLRLPRRGSISNTQCL